MTLPNSPHVDFGGVFMLKHKHLCVFPEYLSLLSNGGPVRVSLVRTLKAELAACQALQEMAAVDSL